MNYQVTLVDADDLTEEELEGQPNNGHGKDYANYLKVIHKDHVKDIYSDAMETEDVTFYRDLGWISVALEEAYKLGYEDGKEN